MAVVNPPIIHSPYIFFPSTTRIESYKATYLSHLQDEGEPNKIVATDFDRDHKVTRDAIVTAILSAKTSINLAVYDLRDHIIAKALAEVATKKVRIRIVCDDEMLRTGLRTPGYNADPNDDISRTQSPPSMIPYLESLKTQDGLDVAYISRKHSILGGSERMHNKFMVIDSSIVWTGSMNFTPHGHLANENTAILLKSTPIATVYEQQFVEMYTGKFGTGDNRASYYEDSLGIRYRILFSPENDIIAHMIEDIEKATSLILLGMFTFTHRQLASAIREKAIGSRTLQIRVLFDEIQEAALHQWSSGNKRRSPSRYKYLHDTEKEIEAEHGISNLLVRKYSPSRTQVELKYDTDLDNKDTKPYFKWVHSGGKLHIKYLTVVQNDIAVTYIGSLNATINASARCDENMLVIEEPLSSYLNVFTKAKEAFRENWLASNGTWVDIP